MAVIEVMNGRLTLGDFVLLNTFLMQIYRPLNFIGFVYREIRQGLTDIEEMFKLLDQDPEIADKPGAKPLAVTGPVIRFEDVHFHYDPDRPILKGVSFEVPAGKTIAVVGPTGRRQVDHLAAALSLLRRHRAGASPSTGRTCATSPRRACAPPSAWSRRTPCCSTTPSATTSAMAAPTRREDEVRAAAPAGADRHLHREPAQGLRHAGRRARPEALGRREAARRHRPHHPQGPADPHPRRGDLGARHQDRAGHPVGARRRLGQPHDAGHRAPALDRRQRRRDHRPARRRHRRARHPPRAARARRPLRRRCGTASARRPRSRSCAAQGRATTPTGFVKTRRCRRRSRVGRAEAPGRP